MSKTKFRGQGVYSPVVATWRLWPIWKQWTFVDTVEGPQSWSYHMPHTYRVPFMAWRHQCGCRRHGQELKTLRPEWIPMLITRECVKKIRKTAAPEFSSAAVCTVGVGVTFITDTHFSWLLMYACMYMHVCICVCVHECMHLCMQVLTEVRRRHWSPGS